MGLDRNRGLALVAVLWLLVLMSAIAISMSRDSQLAIKTATLYIDELQARAILEAGVHQAIAERVHRARIDRAPRSIAGGTVAVEVIDENRRLDLNHATAGALSSLFEQFLGREQTDSVVAAILDWRDGDDDPRPDGAEAGAYRAAGIAHGPRNGPFLHTNEIQQVLGVDRILFDSIAEQITVDGGFAWAINLDRDAADERVGIAVKNPVVRLYATANFGRARTAARIGVLFPGGAARPFRIVSWEWGS